MNDKMVLVTAGVSFVVKTNGEDEDLDSLITSAANAAASELNGVSVSLPNGSGSGSNSGSADGKAGAGGLGSNGSATAAIMEDINCDAIGGVTSIGKLMEELTRSVGNGSYMEDENFAIEVVFGANNGKRLKASSLKGLNKLLSESTNGSAVNGLKESTLKVKRKELEDLKRWILEEFKSPPPPLDFDFPGDDSDDNADNEGESEDDLTVCEDMEANIKQSIERSETVFKMIHPVISRANANLKKASTQQSKIDADFFASAKLLNDFKFKSFTDFVLTKLVISVMDKRRTPFKPGQNDPKPLTLDPPVQIPVPDPDVEESRFVQDYLQDEEFMTEMCFDTMMQTFQQTLCAHLGELAKNFDPKQLSCHNLRWFDTQEVLDHSQYLDPYANFNLPTFDAKGRSLNIVMLTEFSNILQVHYRHLPQRVFDSLKDNCHSRSWMPLIQTCCHYGIMLHDFLKSLDQNESWKVLRKCVWLVVSFLKAHPLIREALADQYVTLPKPELSSAFSGISNSIMDYEHPHIPKGFGSHLQPFRFFHWYLNPHQLPPLLSQHLYLNDYIKCQLPSPRISRAWEALEERNTGKTKQPASVVDQKLKESLEIFVEVERRKLSMNIERVEQYVAQLRISVLLYELAYWLKKIFAAKKSFAPDAYYLCWKLFDDPKFFVPISCADHAMRKQYCKREGIYYLVTRFCLTILHYEMKQAGLVKWDKSSTAYKTFMFLFRRLFLPYAEPDSFAFDPTENCYDRYSAKILQKMRLIMEREKHTDQQANRGYYDLHMENLKLFTNETTQTYVRLEQQVTASLNDVILSPENQKQVDNFITRVLEALVSISTDKNVELIDWPFIGRCVPLYILDLYKLLAKNNLLGYPSVFAYSTKTFIDKFIHEKITKDKRTIDQFFTQQVHDDSRICPFDKIERNPFITLALRYFSAEESRQQTQTVPSPQQLPPVKQKQEDRVPNGDVHPKVNGHPRTGSISSGSATSSVSSSASSSPSPSGSNDRAQNSGKPSSSKPAGGTNNEPKGKSSNPAVAPTRAR